MCFERYSSAPGNCCEPSKQSIDILGGILVSLTIVYNRVRGFFLSFYTLYMYSREYKTMYGWLAFLAKRNVPKKKKKPEHAYMH